MPYYHVRIAKKMGTVRWTFEFDLSKKEVEERIIGPFMQGKSFMCGGSPIEPSNVDQIRINETGESSFQIIKKAKMKKVTHDLLKRFYGIGKGGHSNEWYVTHAGKVVTKDFIRGLRFPDKTSRTFAMKEDVFIVHGRDRKPMKELKAMLKEFGLNPIVLHEQASGARTIIEKLEKYSDVGYTFVILTPEDVGCLDEGHSKTLKSVVGTLQTLIEAYTVIKRKGPLKKACGELSRVISLFKPRARQNVVLEFGYFMGMLGRDRVCCLYTGNLELPSDMYGIVYIPFKESVNEIRNKIVKELKEAGYEIKGQCAGYCDKCDGWSDVLEEIHITGAENLKQVRFLCEKCNTNRLVEALIERTSQGLTRDVTTKDDLIETKRLFVKNRERFQKVLRENIEEFKKALDIMKEYVGEEKERRFWHLLTKVSTASDTTQYAKYVKELLIFLHEKEIIRDTLPFILMLFLEETSSSTSSSLLF